MSPACLIVSYARKENVLRLVNEVINARIERIYVSIDGPRNELIFDIQSELKIELERIQDSCSVQICIWQRRFNMGSGASVIASLDWAFATEDEVIVLEDDLEVSGDFFEFMKYGLGEMKSLDSLKIVTGTNPFEELTQGQYGKVNYPVSWGWATNRDNWQQLRALIFEGAPAKLISKHVIRDLYWSIGRRRALLGNIEAWDIPLACEMCKTGFFSLIPRGNLVRNIGFDKFAAHTIESTWPLNLPLSREIHYENSKLEPRDIVNLNEAFEKSIFKIRVRHLFSWVLHRSIDRFRFKSDSETLLHRTQVEPFP